MNCEMCGKNETLARAVVEGVTINVCSACQKFGKIVGDAEVKKKETLTRRVYNDNDEDTETVVRDFAAIIKREREKRKMEQKQFAYLIYEKESIVHKMESGHFIPTIENAKRIQKILKVKLVTEEKLEGGTSSSSTTKTGPLTIGDLIKKK